MNYLFKKTTLRGLRVYLIYAGLMFLLFTWAGFSGTFLWGYFSGETEKWIPDGKSQHSGPSGSHYYHK